MATCSGARAENTDLLLVLAVDVSLSVDDVEARLQRGAYLRAFADPRVLNAIGTGNLKSL